MKIIIAQSIFQAFVALNLLGVTVQFHIPMVVSTGNGKRSQPSSFDFKPDRIDRQIRVPLFTSKGHGKRIASASFDYNSSRIDRQIRIPLVAATANGKRSQTRSDINSPSMSDIDWFYDPSNEEEGVSMVRNRNKWDSSSTMGLENLTNWSESYLAMASSTQNNRARNREPYTYFEQKFPNGLQLPEINQIFDEMSKYDDPRDYKIDPSLYRSNPLVKTLLALKRRQEILDLLEDKLKNTGVYIENAYTVLLYIKISNKILTKNDVTKYLRYGKPENEMTNMTNSTSLHKSHKRS